MAVLKIFLAFCFIFLPLMYGDDFTIVADNVQNFIVPMFSSTAKFIDFYDTFNFFMDFPQFPDIFYIYTPKMLLYCKSLSNETLRNGSIFNTHCVDYSDLSVFNLSSPLNIQKLFNDSIISNTRDFLQLAQSTVKQTTELCLTHECNITRKNFVLLTDNEKIDIPLSFRVDAENRKLVRHILYFALSSFLKSGENKSSSCMDCDGIDMFYIYQNLDIVAISKYIVANTLSHSFNLWKNAFNIFIVGDEFLIEKGKNITRELVAFSGSPQKLYLPRFFAISIKRNDTFSYQSATIDHNTRMSAEKLLSTAGNITKTFSTSYVEYFIQKVFIPPSDENFTDSDFVQYNVIITDEFPFWLNKTGLIFDSFNRHLDIYIFPKINAEPEVLNNICEFSDLIIVNDSQRTFRGNHLLLSTASNPLEIKQFPTLKIEMEPTFFTYKGPSRLWIWLTVGFGTAFIITIVAGILIYWRFRVVQKQKQKYNWATKFGYTPKEAKDFIRKGKELLLNESNLDVFEDKIIGKGVFAIVYQGFLVSASPVREFYPRIETLNFKDCKVAVKVSFTISEAVFREIEAALKLEFHPHICCLLGWTIYRQTVALVFEYIDGKDMLAWAKSTASPKSIKEICIILRQIVDVMEYVASKGIVHKDLAARNVLLTAKLEIKLTDFGLSSEVGDDFVYQSPRHRRLPIRWMAPEALLERIFSEASDVWSFGVLAWELFTSGEMPYGSIDGNDIIDFLNSGSRLRLPKEVPEKLQNIISKCWDAKRENRPSFGQIKQKVDKILEKEIEKYGYIECKDFFVHNHCC